METQFITDRLGTRHCLSSTEWEYGVYARGVCARGVCARGVCARRTSQ